MDPEEKRLQILSPSLTFNICRGVDHNWPKANTTNKQLSTMGTANSFYKESLKKQLVERLFDQSHGNALKFFSLSRWLQERDLSDVVWAPREPVALREPRRLRSSVVQWLARAVDMRWWSWALPNSTVCKMTMWPVVQCTSQWVNGGMGWVGGGILIFQKIPSIISDSKHFTAANQ